MAYDIVMGVKEVRKGVEYQGIFVLDKCRYDFCWVIPRRYADGNDSIGLTVKRDGGELEVPIEMQFLLCEIIVSGVRQYKGLPITNTNGPLTALSGIKTFKGNYDFELTSRIRYNGIGSRSSK